LVHSGIFVSHFFNINPDLEEITELVAIKLFSSQFENPINRNRERLLVVGLTGSEDDQHRRPKTDFVLLIDRSGSMESSSDTPYGRFPLAGRRTAELRTMELTIDTAKGVFDLVDDDEKVGLLMADHIAEPLESLTAKGKINHEGLFSRLDAIRPRVNINIKIAPCWHPQSVRRVYGVVWRSFL
jgi:hypothetical protein